MSIIKDIYELEAYPGLISDSTLFISSITDTGRAYKTPAQSFVDFINEVGFSESFYLGAPGTVVYNKTYSKAEISDVETALKMKMGFALYTDTPIKERIGIVVGHDSGVPLSFDMGVGASEASYSGSFFYRPSVFATSSKYDLTTNAIYLKDVVTLDGPSDSVEWSQVGRVVVSGNDAICETAITPEISFYDYPSPVKSVNTIQASYDTNWFDRKTRFSEIEIPSNATISSDKFFYYGCDWFEFRAEEGYDVVIPVELVLTSVFFFSSRRRHTRSLCDWSSDVCSSDLDRGKNGPEQMGCILIRVV